MSESKTPAQKPVWKDLFAGYIGGCAQCLAGQPFDIVKVRLQNQSAANPVYSSTFDAFKQIGAQEGLAGFYKGTIAPLIGNAFMCSALFTINEG
jgi:solute carrier family 25 carnitine/acylcarnitine transporter 20/29